MIERADVTALLREAQRIAGPGAITMAEVVSQQPRRLLPRGAGQTQQGRPITP